MSLRLAIPRRGSTTQSTKFCEPELEERGEKSDIPASSYPPETETSSESTDPKRPSTPEPVTASDGRKLHRKNERGVDDERKIVKREKEESRKGTQLDRLYKEAVQAYDKKVDELVTLESRYNGLCRQFKGLQSEYGNLQKKYSSLEKENHYLYSQFTRIKEAHEPLVKRCSALDKDNDDLRSQIANMGSAQEPLREENYYILQFSQINNDIDSWAAKETRTKPPELSDETLDQLVSLVMALANLSDNAAETLKTMLLRFHQDRRIRIVVTRHIISALLFYHVFDRFTFGLPRDSSDYFKYIEERIYNQGAFLQGLYLH